MTKYIQYESYDLRSYFSIMPGHIKTCFHCGHILCSKEMHFSKVVAEDMKWDSLIPVHDFTILFQCDQCSWWCVRESWGFYETSNCMYDRLVVGVIPVGDQIEHKDDAPWLLALDDEKVYENLLNLPKGFAKLFSTK